MTHRVLVLPGDGIGPEVMAETVAVIELVNQKLGIEMSLEHALLGGAAIDAEGVPYPESTAQKAHQADAIILGAVGGPKWDGLDRAIRPEKGLLGIRSDLQLFGNLRPAILYPQLAGASSLKPDLVAGLDLLIVRELTGGIYFGQPRGFDTTDDGQRRGYNTYVYTESEIRRVAVLAFDLARKRGSRVCSVDKANVLEATMLWREVVNEVAKDYPDVELSHMYVDNAAMQLARDPNQFDVLFTENMFGDILSDEMGVICGSLGMLASASLGAEKNSLGFPFGLYEPSGGTAPDIAGQGIANPCAQILSGALMLRYSFGELEAADAIEAAVEKAVTGGTRTGDIAFGLDTVGTKAMGEAVLANL